MYAKVAPFFGVAKVGLSLFVEHGPAAVRAFQKEGAQVFLDLKLHDIPNTVELAAARAAERGGGDQALQAGGGPKRGEAAGGGTGKGATRPVLGRRPTAITRRRRPRSSL